ncbi:hypothetical protein L1887_63221 [Cichorium endivia]|nr:hypothetical protein L1887_63221 [Cichorium endivia]
MNMFNCLQTRRIQSQIIEPYHVHKLKAFEHRQVQTHLQVSTRFRLAIDIEETEFLQLTKRVEDEDEGFCCVLCIQIEFAQTEMLEVGEGRRAERLEEWTESRRADEVLDERTVDPVAFWGDERALNRRNEVFLTRTRVFFSFSSVRQVRRFAGGRVAVHVPRDGERRFICVINLVNEGIAVLDEKLDQVHAFQSDGQVQNAVALLEFLVVVERKSIGISLNFEWPQRTRSPVLHAKCKPVLPFSSIRLIVAPDAISRRTILTYDVICELRFVLDDGKVKHAKRVEEKSERFFCCRLRPQSVELGKHSLRRHIKEAYLRSTNLTRSGKWQDICPDQQNAECASQAIDGSLLQSIIVRHVLLMRSSSHQTRDAIKSRVQKKQSDCPVKSA